MEAAYLQDRMLFHSTRNMSNYEFIWRSIAAPSVTSTWWSRCLTALLFLALVISVAFRKVKDFAKRRRTTSPYMAGVKRMSNNAIECEIVDTEKGLEEDGISGHMSLPVLLESEPAGIRHVLWRLFHGGVSFSGKKE